MPARTSSCRRWRFCCGGAPFTDRFGAGQQSVSAHCAWSQPHRRPDTCAALRLDLGIIANSSWNLKLVVSNIACAVNMREVQHEDAAPRRRPPPPPQGWPAGVPFYDGPPGFACLHGCDGSECPPDCFLAPMPGTHACPETSRRHDKQDGVSLEQGTQDLLWGERSQSHSEAGGGISPMHAHFTSYKRFGASELTSVRDRHHSPRNCWSR